MKDIATRWRQCAVPPLPVQLRTVAVANWLPQTSHSIPAVAFPPKTSKLTEATDPRHEVVRTGLYLGYQLSITTALARKVDAGTEVTMTRTDSVSSELV
jgi:hypothetical protein